MIGLKIRSVFGSSGFICGKESIVLDLRSEGDKTKLSELIAQGVFSKLTYPQAVDRLTESQTAYGAVNSVYDLIEHQ